MSEFKNPSQMSRQEIVNFFSNGSSPEICHALLSMVFYDEDWKWAQDTCLHFLDHPDVDVKSTAITCLGHIARIHGKLDLEDVTKTLKKYMHDQEFSGRIEDTLDDIQVFIKT